MIDLRAKQVVVMGLGFHGGGLGVTRWLLKQGAVVTVTDLKNEQELKPTLDVLRESVVGGSDENAPQLRFVLGQHREADFVNADLIIRNPGVPAESRYLSLARARGIPVRMELGLFLEQLPRGVSQVIGITGTKGKTTTTLMVGAVLKRVNPATVVAGNLRVSALEMLNRIDADTPVVLEMSSFQLEEFEELKISPHVAAITNIYPDHLNRYRDLDSYARAKAQIFLHQSPRDICVLNFDNPILTRMRPKAIGHVVWFSRTRALNDGALMERGWIVWNDHGAKQLLLPVTELIAGQHNIENALAATAITSSWGARPEIIRAALADFEGVPHRLETVRVIDGITFINDTTATAPEASIEALRTFGGRDGSTILIAGGSDKGLQYREMAQAIRDGKVQVILLQGDATEKLERALTSIDATSSIVARVNRLEDAVVQARRQARSGDIVLLSPGAASFGMFVNEFDRGDQFREIVLRLDQSAKSKN